MVFVKLDGDKIVDMIIGEIKLSEGTALSAGQAAARAQAALTDEVGSLVIKSLTRSLDGNGNRRIVQGESIVNDNFVKIFSDGEGVFEGGIDIAKDVN